MGQVAAMGVSRKVSTGQPSDAARIDIYEDRDVAYWTRRWGITRAELTHAVRKVGTSPAAVAAELERAHV